MISCCGGNGQGWVSRHRKIVGSPCVHPGRRLGYDSRGGGNELIPYMFWRGSPYRFPD